jgi:archaellum component FlaG (FlaF/FlaG flagellin family)
MGMKKYYFFSLILLFITLNAYAQNRPSVRIVNNTGYDIYYLYIRQTATEDWEEDVLDEDVLLDGDYINVELLYPLSVANRYDIMLEDEDGDTYTKLDVLIKENTQIEFTIGDID